MKDLGCFPPRALQFGNQYIYQAMPRMLSLWLDFGAKVCECDKGRWPVVTVCVK